MRPSHRAVFLVLTILAIFFLGSLAPAAEAEGPRLHVPDSTWNFSRVTAGEPLERTFTVENTGTAPLVIRRILHSCGGAL